MAARAGRSMGDLGYMGDAEKRIVLADEVRTLVRMMLCHQGAAGEERLMRLTPRFTITIAHNERMLKPIYLCCNGSDASISVRV